MKLIKGLYENQKFSKTLLGFCIHCESCRDAAQMCATGNLFHEPDSTFWDLEFFCETCGETMEKYDVNWEPMIQKALNLAEDV